jgi:hypothetical protein
LLEGSFAKASSASAASTSSSRLAASAKRSRKPQGFLPARTVERERELGAQEPERTLDVDAMAFDLEREVAFVLAE